MLIRTRRDFIKTAFGVAGAAGALGKFGDMPSYAVNPSNYHPYQTLFCAYMSGGNDGHNTIFPITTAKQNYSLYKTGRGNLALPQTGVPTINNGADVYGMHPKLAEIAQLYSSGAAAVVANVGSLVKNISKQEY